MSSNPPRRNYTGDEKMATQRGALLEKINVSDVCQKHGITPGMFYEWQKKLFEQGSVVFNGMATAARPTAGDARKLATAEAKIQQKNGELFAKYMNGPDFQRAVSEHLRKQVYEQIRQEGAVGITT